MVTFAIREAVRTAILLLIGWLAVEVGSQGHVAMGRVAMEPWGPGRALALTLAVLFAVGAVAGWHSPGVSVGVVRLTLAAQALVPASLLLSAPTVVGWSPGLAHRVVLGGGWSLAALWLGTVLYRLATTSLRRPGSAS